MKRTNKILVASGTKNLIFAVVKIKLLDVENKLHVAAEPFIQKKLAVQ